MARDPVQGDALIRAVHAFDPALPLLTKPDGHAAQIARAAGMRVVTEAYADRAYGADGGLVPRGQPGAVLTDRGLVASRAVTMVTAGTVRASDGTRVRLAVTGAAAAITVRAGRGEPATPREFGSAFEVPDGWLVSVGPASAGLRSYLAVSGGLATQAELGSRSADLHSGIGGPLRSGAILPVGAAGPAAEATRPQGPAQVPARGVPARLRILPGPRADRFEPAALQTPVRVELHSRHGEQQDRAAARGPGPRQSDRRGAAERGHADRFAAGAA